MVATIPFNPNTTTVAQGAFSTTSVGYVQGDMLPDPAIIYKKVGGILSQNETLPMWQGVGLYEFVPGGAGNPSATLGPIVGRATALTGSYPLAGFSVSSYGQINTPQSPVPLAASGMQVQYFRLGSGARIVVQADPNLIALQGEPTVTDVSWDFANQKLVPYSSTTISSGTYTTAATISSGTYTPSTGAVSLTMNTSHGLTAGDAFTLSAVTGTGSFAVLDGTQIATAGTTGSTLNFAVGTGLTMTITGGDIGTGVASMTTAAPHGLLPGDTFELSSMTGTNAATYLDGEFTAAAGTTGSTLNVLLASGLTLTISGGTLATGGILPVKVLDVVASNCQIVNYNAPNATWSYTGACAVILI